MKIVRFETHGNIKYGIFEKDVLRGIKGNPFSDYKGPGRSFLLDGSTYQAGDVKILAPCYPTKYIGIGLNFYQTTREMKMPVPKVPIIFLKPTTSIIGPDDNIILPYDSSAVLHEGELALVIGKEAKNVTEEKAREYLFGFTCTNDVSDVSVFEEDRGNPTRTKGRDTFGPLGPCIETEIDPGDLTIETYVNGELRQRGSTSDFIFGINKIISFVSGVMTLLPGDIIATGSPPGADKIKPGDVVEVKVGKIGTLKNYVIGSN